MNTILIFLVEMILSILLMFCATAAMFEKRKTSLFLLFFVLGISFCYSAAFLLEGLPSISLSIIIYLKFIAILTGLWLVKENAIR